MLQLRQTDLAVFHFFFNDDLSAFELFVQKLVVKGLEHVDVVLAEDVVTGVVKQVEVEVVLCLKARDKHVLLILQLQIR